MKEKLMKFVVDRLRGKITEAQNMVDEQNGEMAWRALGDIEVYSEQLIEIVTEIIKP